MKRLLLILSFMLLPFPAPAGAATVSDEFNRADSFDVGTNWDNGYSGAQSCQLLSNRVQPSAPADTCYETWNANSFTNDQWAQITMSVLTAPDLSVVSIILRAASPATATWYRIAARHNDGSASTRIFKYASGSVTELASENTVTWVSGDVLYAQVSGTTITAKRNGITILTATDSDLTAGRIGFNVAESSVAGATQADSFFGGDLTAATRRKVGAMAFQ